MYVQGRNNNKMNIAVPFSLRSRTLSVKVPTYLYIILSYFFLGEQDRLGPSPHGTYFSIEEDRQ